MKKFIERFYEEIKLNNDGEIPGCFSMTKDRFIQILDEMLNNFGNDTQAEVGAGIYKMIQKLRMYSISDNEIVEKIFDLCKKLMSYSPESALEFSSIMEKESGKKD